MKKALNLKNRDTDEYILDLTSICAISGFLTKKPKMSTRLDNFLNDFKKIKPSKESNIDFRKILDVIDDTDAYNTIHSIILGLDSNKLSEVFLGQIADNFKTSPEPERLRKVAKMLLYEGGRSNALTRAKIMALLNAKTEIDIVEAFLTQNKNSNSKIYKLNDFMRIICYYWKYKNTIPEIEKFIVNDMINNKIPIDDMIMLIDYLGYDTKRDSGQYDFAVNILKLETPDGEKRFDRTCVEAMLDVLPQPLDKSDMKKMYEIALKNPQATTSQIIRMFRGEKVEVAASIENPFGENGKYKVHMDRIKKNLEKMNLIEEDIADLTNYLEELVKQDPNRFERLVDSGYFELCAENKINIYHGILKNIGTKKFFSKTYLEDVKRLYKGESAVKEFEKGTELDVVAKNLPIGEVASVGEKLYVNDGGKMVELKMSRKTFERLFPPETRFNLMQGGLGDCWLVSAIDNLMDMPAGRAKIYQLFEENGNDITITFPAKKGYASKIATYTISDEFKVPFPNGKPLNTNGKEISGCDGLKMLEQAYSFKRGDKPKQSITLDEMASLVDTDTQMEKLRGGITDEFINDIFGYTTRGILSTYDIVDQNNNKVGKKIGISHKGGVDNDVVDLIKEFANNPNVLLHTSSIHLADDAEHLLNEEYSIYSNHAYTIKGFNEETGMVYFTNPHDAKCIVEMDVYKFLSYFDSLTYIRMK